MGKDKTSKNNRIHGNSNSADAEFSREFAAKATNNGKQKYMDTPSEKKQ